jgi:hypothetical protein
VSGAFKLAHDARELSLKARREAFMREAAEHQRLVTREVEWIKQRCLEFLIANPHAVGCVVPDGTNPPVANSVRDDAAKVMANEGFRVSWKKGRWYHNYYAAYTVRGWADAPSTTDGPYR